MKKRLLFFIFCSTLFITSCNYSDTKSKKSNFKEQIGTYRLDVNRTNLKSYAKDSELYRDITITFKADSTFVMNKRVPFIYDSCGTWYTGGSEIESWNYLRFKRNKKIKTQFTVPWTSDSIFYMNSTTPQEGKEFIQEIYFKKITH